MQADGNIIIDTKINSSGINEGTKQIKDAFAKETKGIQGTVEAVQNSLSRLGGMAKKIGAAVAATFVVRQVAQFAGECLRCV